MFSETHFIFMLFETNLDSMLYAFMLFGNPPFQRRFARLTKDLNKLGFRMRSVADKI